MVWPAGVSTGRFYARFSIIPSAMILRRCDRYVLRETTGMFFISVFGLVVFLLLSFILEVSYLVADYGVGIITLLRLLVLKTPWILGLALPAGCLFATIIGLGRLVYDREVMALEASGISLRRLLLPLLVFALLVGGLDFVLFNWGVPFSEQAYQRETRQIVFRYGEPHIQPETVFKGPEGQFFYVQRYDSRDGSLREVWITDAHGKLFPFAEAAVTMIYAKQGRWEGTAWSLVDGRVYGYDDEGLLIYTAAFERLSVPVGQLDTDIIVRSKTPTEMGIGELSRKIAALRKSGLSANAFVVECHRKIAIPLAGVVFVLLGGSISLIFGGRSRAAGIVVSLLLVSLFWGVFLWSSTLGSRGVIYPPLASWIAHLIFGFLGILLFLRLDRLSSRDLWNRIRHALPFLGMLVFVGVITMGQDVPVEIDCEELFISNDRQHIHAQGDVHMHYGETTLSAGDVTLDEMEGNLWTLRAAEQVSLVIGEDFSLTGEELSTQLALGDGALAAREATAVRFLGKSRFLNSKGEEHFLFYQGEEGRIQFDSTGEIAFVDVRNGEFSTCDCCGVPLGSQPYTVEMGRLLLYPDELVVAFGLTVRSLGYFVFWLPVYVQPLEETLESPLFPAIGRSGLRGWFLKWNVPFYLDQKNYGAILFDYFSRFFEVGLGAVLRYSFGSHQGKARLYYFPARVGDSTAELSVDHTLSLPESGWELGGHVTYQAVGEERDLSFSSSLRGEVGRWRLTLSAERKREEMEEEVRIVERTPELVLAGTPVDVGVLSLLPQMSLGWLREWKVEEEETSLIADSQRFDGALDFTLKSMSLHGFDLNTKGGVRLTHYEGESKSQNRETLSFSSLLSAPGMALSYTYLQVVGKSPFQFDRLVSTNQIDWRIFREGQISLQMEGGFSLAARLFEPLFLRVTWQGGAALSLESHYDLSKASVEDVTLWGRWQAEACEVSYKVEYSPPTGQFSPLTVQVRGASGMNAISLQGEIDLMRGEVNQAELGVELSFEQGWGVHLLGRYEPEATPVFDPGFGLFRDVCGCLRIGIERQFGQIWLYTSILAFPEGVLRYTPSAGSLQFGG